MPRHTPSPLPPGYVEEEELATRDGTRTVRARRGDEVVVLRLEHGPTGESHAELAVLAAVSHPGITPLIDHGALPGGGRFAARAWVPGVDLGVWAEGRSPEEIGAALARLAPALAHLHDLGFVHADLKPENVIVAHDGSPVLCDFGFAAPIGSRPETRGSLFSVAPEVLLGGAPTAASDLFALGVMLHRLLVRPKRSARDFYADFPQKSYFDAVRSSPEELPEWARDLVATLTSRDPDRRQGSAHDVARELGARLGVAVPRTASVELRWPVAFGREAWLTSWWNEASEAKDDVAECLRLPEGESPEAFWRHLRLFVSLRGCDNVGIELGRALRDVRDTAALDRWARETVRSSTAWILVSASRPGPWEQRALSSLARAARQTPRSERTRIVLVADRTLEDELWSTQDVPAADEATISRFLRRRLATDGREELERFAKALHARTQGSASSLDKALQDAARHGLVVPGEPRPRLRAGAQVEAAARDDDDSALSDSDRHVLAALHVCGGSTTTEQLERLTQLDSTTLGTALLSLRASGRITLPAPGPEARVHACAAIPVASLGTKRLRELHARCALALGDDSPAALLHRACADPRDETIGSFIAALDELRDRGCAELALELGDRFERFVSELKPEAELAPRLAFERAKSWCALEQPELALDAIESLSEEGDHTLGRKELIRAHVARLRHEHERAMGLYESAVRHAPELRAEAKIHMVRQLFATGRDADALREIANLNPQALETAGELSARQRAYLESVAAMSRFRQGEITNARESIERLIDEARDLEDRRREAALRIDLATIERRAGSLARAEEELRTSMRLFEDEGLVSGLAHARETLGGLLRETGELRSAQELLSSALEIRERLGDAEGASTTRGILGLLLFERGHVAPAIAALESSLEAMGKAQRLRFGGLLRAKAAELRARVGRPLPTATEGEGDADPRTLLALARTRWLEGDAEKADALAERARALATSLGLGRLADEASLLRSWLEGVRGPIVGLNPGVLAAEDGEILAHLTRTGADFDEARFHAHAKRMEERGRDDRAARAWMALAARSTATTDSRGWQARAEALIRECCAGLTDEESQRLRRLLLGIPDPFPGDFTTRTDRDDDTEFEMDVTSLLDINRKLIHEEDVASLLRAIVEHAVSLTGAERGFLVLEEGGELRFDTARDSCHGEIDEPEFEISGSVVREALEQMEAIRVSNAVDDALLGRNASVVSLELRSILCVPVEITSSLRAAIYVDHRLRTGAFDERSERLCSLLAGQAALAIQQVRRLEEIRNLNDQLGQRVVEQASDLKTARRALHAAGLPGPASGLVGGSDAMRKVHAFIERAGPSNLPILVLGASGTGKELAARALHNASNRKARPFVSESCAALPPSLIESELFGHVQGAFTGADRDRTGLFEKARGGTLFLDEIGELPLDLQAKLLRVLETSEVRRIGASSPTEVDFRLVVATNRDLEHEVREKRFREDLFFRLDGLRLEMPPLAERTEDIQLLVEHFLDLQESETGVRHRVAPPVLRRLCRRAWPGNVRELRNEIARLCVLCEGDIDDPELVREAAEITGSEPEDELVTLDELERRAILRALKRAGGDKRKAAELLGISRTTIYQRLKDWSEDDPA